MDANQLTGPLSTELLSNPNVRWVHLQDNAFTGPIPTTIGQMSSINELILTNNPLDTTIPSTMYTLTSLTHLDMSYTRLQGTLSEDVSNWNASMELLLWNNNNLTGPVPMGLGALTQTRELVLHSNSFLTGTIAATVCANKGRGFFSLQNLTAPVSVSCACCDLML